MAVLRNILRLAVYINSTFYAYGTCKILSVDLLWMYADLFYVSLLIFLWNSLNILFDFQYLREKFETKVTGNNLTYCSKFDENWNMKEVGTNNMHFFTYLYCKISQNQGFWIITATFFTD